MPSSDYLVESYARRCSRDPFFLGYWLRLARVTASAVQLSPLDWQKLRVCRAPVTGESAGRYLAYVLDCVPAVNLFPVAAALDTGRN